MAVDKNGGFKVDLKLIQQRNLGHLIKRARIHKDGSQDIELEPKVPALVKLGEHYKLWKGEAQEQLTLVELAKGMREEYEQMQSEEGNDPPAEVLSGPTGAVQ